MCGAQTNAGCNFPAVRVCAIVLGRAGVETERATRMKVEQILQSKGTDVYSIGADQTIADAVSVLNSKNIGAVVVQGADGDAVGILSERDVVRRLGARGAEALNEKVSVCMTAKPFTCSPSDDVDHLMNEMTNKRIRHLPVKNGTKLVGVVSIGDVVKRKIEQAEQEAEALKEYIAG